ncbi:MAG: hybrid sensor histidine kinase/response regulator [Thermoanaerobaculia bacterium]
MASPAEAPSLRALLVATDESDVVRLRDLVARMPARVEVDWARSFEAGFSRMTASRYDAYLVAGRLGERSGVELLRAYQEAGGGAPVIVLGGAVDDRVLDLDAMEAGAAGFLALDRLYPEALERSIRYAVESRRREIVLRNAREELRESVDERSASLETMNAALAAEVAERRRAELKLRDVDRRKNEFLATLAHELRNPLAPIRHAMELLARLERPETEQTPAAEARRVIERQVTHLVRLIDDLLDISRISYGKVGLRTEQVSLASVVESALEATRPLLLERGHELEAVLPQVPIVLNGDPVRLAQILTNLLTNAAWYTEPCGRVRVEAGREGLDVVVRVFDSGIGISADALERIFTMFGQGAETRSLDHGGLGIGLALAKKLAELHGGSLTAASDGPGKGSLFTLRLPVETGVRTSPDARASATAMPFTPRRVLVVDDNVDAARTLADLLALDGHESHVAYDGPSAVEAAQRLRPDAAILDLGLPGFSGLEVGRRLREDPALSGILLVALSGWVQPEDLVRSREAGFDHHLAKPVGTATLELLLKLARVESRSS